MSMRLTKRIVSIVRKHHMERQWSTLADFCPQKTLKGSAAATDSHQACKETQFLPHSFVVTSRVLSCFSFSCDDVPPDTAC